jgi:two-component system cell cycle sensor histidine kinase/response regulator CckA
MDLGSAQDLILNRMAAGAPLAEILGEIVRLIEEQADGMLCTIMLLDEEHKHVRSGAWHALSPEFMASLDGIPIGPRVGSCGAAAYLGERIIVEDIATHPYWEGYRHLTEPFGLRACWSSPIFSAEHEVLGTFAMYYREARVPTEEELAWVDAATHLAAIALMRDRDDKLLSRSQAQAQTDEALRALIYDSVEDVIFYVRVEAPGRYRMLYVNGAYERSTGLRATDVVGRLVTDSIPPSSQEAVLAKYTEAIARREKVRWESVSPYPTGERHGEVTLSPIFGPDGACTHLVGTVHDVTEARRAEAERAELLERVYRAQRLQALGTLAGGVAHDFNNLLSVILSYAEIAREELPPESPLRAEMDEILSAATRGSEMTRQLLAFGRQQVLAPRVLNLNDAVVRMERMLRRLLREDIELVTLPGADHANVNADPGQLEQIVMNLVVNARDAMPNGGKLTIETSNVTLEDEAAHERDLPAGRYVLLAVQDCGTGMDPATQARIFEPFFTSKELGKGTGLGLATVFGIVKQSGGHIAVTSAPLEGATFEVYLPSVDDEIDAVVSEVPPEALTGNETVLLVEDDDQVRTLARGILRRNGYVVLDAANAGEAMLISDQHAARIDLLLADVVLPRVSGQQLAARLRPLRPEMRVLFMSGYVGDTTFDAGVAEHFLPKPLTPLTLLRKVREALS